ncbi:transporter [Kaistia algarum]|uniref:AEC family transporter n=1 Tax=Kaistia algarum TaxID=2083279 RepID=UPI000CE7DD06|nr:AEC family transporter [Kaistia algarum]MCX5515394.1 AEC family transporter [Kaistia algarum]PPE78557.1 transporter [Kaistia algarum]
MHEIVLIVLCLAIGALLRWSGRLPEGANKVLGAWVINVALPAAAIGSLRGIAIDSAWWLAAATPWIGVGLAIVVLVPVCRALGWSRQRTGALLLGAGWGNTSFVGLPMIAAFAGRQWLGLGIVIDLFGSYLALSTLGLAIAAVASSGKLDGRAVAKRIATFPPFIALIVAIATKDLARPDWVTSIVESLSATLTPIALAAVGSALRFDRLAGHLPALGVGLAFRLLLAPLAFVGLYLALGTAGDPVAKVAMLEMAMPPMLGASIIALDHDLEPDLGALLIGIGVPLSMATVWAWWTIIATLRP